MNEAGAEITLNKLYEEILRGKTEIKNSIEASETKVLEKIGALNHRINELEEENIYLKNKIDKLEQETRKKGVVIFGIERPAEGFSTKYIIEELIRLVGVNLIESDISNFYNIGREVNSPLKVEFVSYLKKIEILKNCGKLKNTQISIYPDLTKKQQEEKKVLKKHLNIARKNDLVKSYIKGNRLFINNDAYTAAQLEESGINVVTLSTAKHNQELISLNDLEGEKSGRQDFGKCRKNKEAKVPENNPSLPQTSTKLGSPSRNNTESSAKFVYKKVTRQTKNK